MPTRVQRDVFLQPLALPRAVHGPCDRRKMTVSTINGLHVLAEKMHFSRRPLTVLRNTYLVTMGVHGEPCSTIEALLVGLIGPQKRCFGLVCTKWAKVGWPFATTVCQFVPKSLSTFFSHIDPLTTEAGPGCYLQFSKIGPHMGPQE